jgi:zinc/manganese transport system ATP-binding protein
MVMTDSSSTLSSSPSSTRLEPVIQVSEATVMLGGRTIWQGVDLTVQPGEFLAILGPNGAGKSTLLKAILGLLPLSAGTISVLGKPARRGNVAIGYVPQRRHFEADVHVRGRSMVQLGLTGRNFGLTVPFLQPRQARENARLVSEVIELVGATAYADRPIGELSGGE